MAQESVSIEEALQICNRIKKERDRLDCFEGLARATGPADPVSKDDDMQVREGPVTVVKPEPETAEPVLREPAPASTKPPSGPDVAAVEPGQQNGSAASAEDQRGGNERVIILTEEQAKERLRAPLTPREKGERYEATVRKAWFNGERKLFVLLDNGELWKQNQSKRPTLPKPGDPVSLNPSVRMTILNP